jgi:Ca2+-binding RTX toxin-like protein
MSGTTGKGIVVAAALLALAGGAATAVVAAKGDKSPITLEGANEKRLTIHGSAYGETIKVSGSAAGGVTLQAEDLSNNFENMRTDCEVLGVVSTDAVCTSTYRTIESDLEDRGDKLRFGGLDAQGVTVKARGGSGKDTIVGSNSRDHLDGDGGDDTLRGKGNADDLDGGPGKDDCAGGAGNDQVNHCE